MEDMAVAQAKPFWRGKNVLVTGGAGFIGYALATKLAKDGARVYVLDIKPSLPHFEHEAGMRKKISYIRGSVVSKRTVARVLKQKRIQTIFHLAAEAIVGRANANPLTAIESNGYGTAVLLECARSQKRVGAIVVASSDKAYGSHDKLPYREDAPLQGRNPYDCSKSCTDLIAQMYAHTFAMPIGILRCGNVYGPGDTNWSRLIPDAFRCVSRGVALDIRSDGSYKRDYIYIDDIVESYLTLARSIESGKHWGEAFNIGINKPLRVAEVLKEVTRVAPNLAYRIKNTARNEIRDQYLDSRKARRSLKWRPRVSVRQGFKKTGAWYTAHLSRQ